MTRPHLTIRHTAHITHSRYIAVSGLPALKPPHIRGHYAASCAVNMSKKHEQLAAPCTPTCPHSQHPTAACCAQAGTAPDFSCPAPPTPWLGHQRMSAHAAWLPGPLRGNANPFASAAACAATPLLAGIPEERPSRRKRLLCFGLVAFAVVAAVVAAAVVVSDSGASPAPAAGLAASGSPPGGGTSSGASSQAESDGSGRDSSAQAVGAGGEGSSGKWEEVGQAASLPPPVPQSSLGTHPPHASGAAHAHSQAGGPPLPLEQPSNDSAAADGPNESADWDAGSDQWGGGWAGSGWEAPGVMRAPSPAPAAEASSSSGYKLRFLAVRLDASPDCGGLSTRPNNAFPAVLPSFAKALKSIQLHERSCTCTTCVLPSFPCTHLHLTLLQVGDWGRRGQYNQSDVAALMGQVAALDPPTFVVSTGDNFYDHGLQVGRAGFTAVETVCTLQRPGRRCTDQLDSLRLL